MEIAESYLSGIELGLNLVERIASSKTQHAARVTWHAHDCFELLFVLDGATAYEFSDGTSVELPGEHFLVIPPHWKHRGLHGLRRPGRLCSVLFDPLAKKAAHHTPFTSSDLTWFSGQFKLAQQSIRRMSPELRSLTKIMSRDLEDAVPKSGLDLAGLRITICGIVLEAAKLLALRCDFKPSQSVETAIAFMKSNLTTHSSIQQLAAIASCSRARLYEMFKESTGMTPNDYWQRLRIDRAQELLRGSEQSVTEIALNCGFSSSQYFCGVFRKYSGMSPSEYRHVMLHQQRS
jgi:AraC-like DNA-binding protein